MAVWDRIADEVLKDIAAHDGRPGSQVKIAERLQCTPNAVQIALRILKRKGKVVIAEQGDFRKPNVYRVVETEKPIDADDIDRLIEEGAEL